MGSELDVEIARVFMPLENDLARYLGSHGGRGSAKSHYFADKAVRRAIRVPGTRGLCVREIQKSLKESAKRLIEDKIKQLGVGALFDPRADGIATPGGGVFTFVGMQDHTAESVKSYEGYDFGWGEEANKLSSRSLTLLRPTIRKPGSQLWFNWNPLRKADPVDQLLRGGSVDDLNAVVVQSNWRDNPWFPDVLEQERSYDEVHNVDTYDNVWEGAYATAIKGAYYAESLSKAKAEGRIGIVPRDPLAAIQVFCDLGGSSGTADAFAMWVCQFTGRTIAVLNHYEAQGQGAEMHFNWLRDNDYHNAQIHLPHDGVQIHGPVNVSWEKAFKDAGFNKVSVIKNQGQGAAMIRIHALRRIFPALWFNEETTQIGRETLGFYHAKMHQQLDTDLGPEHDWASHTSDALGLMACVFSPPKAAPEPVRRRVFTTLNETEPSQAWMGR